MKKISLIIFVLALVSSCTTKNNDLISLPKNFFPEGVASDSDGNIYVGSLKKGTIYKAKANSSKAKQFIAPNEGGLMTVVGMVADNNGNLYACSSDPGVSEFTKTGKVSLKKIDLKTKSIQASYTLPGGGFCNDIAIDNNNNVYVTDSFNPRVLVLKNGSNKLKTFVSNNSFSGEGFNLNGIAFDGKSNLYVVKYNDGKLFRINLSKKYVKEISLPRPLFTPDGLKYVNNKLIVVEGASESSRGLATAGLGRLTEITLKGSKATLKTMVDGLDVPTTFTTIGNKIWVVESQYDHLFKHKDINPEEFLIRKFDIN